MYAKIKNNQIEKYPYYIKDLNKDNPQVSFPSTITNEILNDYGIVQVLDVEKPTYDYTKNCIEKDPILEQGIWKQVWEVSEASTEEKEYRVNKQANTIRNQRNELLKESDWTQLPDATVLDKQGWIDYRQALRDLTSQSGFPFNVTFPTLP